MPTAAASIVVTEHVRSTVQRGPDDSEFVYRTATRAKALDAVRGILPAAATSNVGIYGTGQAFEALLLRMRANPLPESREYSELMLHELRKVIPSFLRRVDLPERGGRWSEYLAATRDDTAALVDELFGATPVDAAAEVELVDFDPEAEDKLLAAICYSHSTLPEHQLLDRVRRLGVDERVSLLKAYVGERENRRHKPGRAFERSFYRFDVLSDYGAFRDMQRHRMLTIEWQRLTPNHGYTRPDLVDEAGLGAEFDEAMHRSAALYDALDDDYPEPGRRTRCRWPIGCATSCSSTPARRSTCSSCARRPQGHPSYRRVALEMHRLIGQQAGHHAIAAAMSHMTTHAPELERLESERRAEARREGS